MLARRTPEVFVSYASQDRDQVLSIADRLQAAGVRLWLDRSRIEGATKWAEEVVHGVETCKIVVLMCSDAAMRSWAVKQEIQLAGQSQKILLPLILERTGFPAQMKFFLAGWQYIEVLDRPVTEWFPQLLRALTNAGVEVAHSDGTPGFDTASANTSISLEWSWEGLRQIARYTDQMWPIPADRPAQFGTRSSLRGLGAPQPDAEHTYRVGARVRLVIESETSVNLLLLDEGPEGIIYCLCPSHFAREPFIQKGLNIFPQAHSRFDSFLITGRLGREYLLAILSDQPLRFEWATCSAQMPAHVLTSPELDSLLSHLRRLKPNQWTAIATYFDIVG